MLKRLFSSNKEGLTTEEGLSTQEDFRTAIVTANGDACNKICQRNCKRPCNHKKVNGRTVFTCSC
jgi:hypothetical protein